MNRKMKNVFRCVECGACGQNVTEGSMRHPYCKKCFKKVFNNDYDKYFAFLEFNHNQNIE